MIVIGRDTKPFVEKVYGKSVEVKACTECHRMVEVWRESVGHIVHVMECDCWDHFPYFKTDKKLES